MSDSCRLIELASLEAGARAALLQRSEADLSGFRERVRPILEAVRQEGDAALVRCARERGYRRLGVLCAGPVGPESLKAAIDGCVMGDFERRSRQTESSAGLREIEERVAAEQGCTLAPVGPSRLKLLRDHHHGIWDVARTLFVEYPRRSVLGVVLMWLSYRAFDKLTPQVDFAAELKKGNVAVAIFIAALFLSIALIIGHALN